MTTPNVVQGAAVAVSTDDIRNRRVRDIIETLPNTTKWLAAKGLRELAEFLVTDYVYHNPPKSSFDFELLAFRQFIARHRLTEQIPQILSIVDHELTAYFDHPPGKAVLSSM